MNALFICKGSPENLQYKRRKLIQTNTTRKTSWQAVGVSTEQAETHKNIEKLIGLYILGK